MEFTTEQWDLAATCSQLFREFPRVDLDRLEVLPKGHPELRRNWRKIAEQGVLGALAPPASGGSGLTDFDTVLVLEEIGYAGLAEPVLETMSVGVPLLRDFGQEEAHESLIDAMVAGQLLATVAYGSEGLSAWGEDADLIFIGKPEGVYLLTRSEFSATRTKGVDSSRRLAWVEGELSSSCLVSGPEGTEAMNRRLAVGAAAVLNGVSRRLLDDSVRYAIERHQFGQAVGSFQAVKHLLADVLVALETARSASWQAALSLGDGRKDAAIWAYVAKSAANRSAGLASNTALQVHGGMGYTWEYGLHVWMKRALALGHAYGTTDECHRALGQRALNSGDLVKTFSFA